MPESSSQPDPSTGRPPLGTRLMYVAFGLMEFVLPKRTRSENWPL